MDICFSLALASTVLLRAAPAVTLAWQHSVEHVAVEEDWRATPAGLVLDEVRTRGLGAGVHVGDDARLVDGWWRFTPPLPPQLQVALANSRFAAGYRLCHAGRCERLADLLAPAADRAVVMAPCAATIPACSSSNCWPPKARRGAAVSP
jgi:hypothetical protein